MGAVDGAEGDGGECGEHALGRGRGRCGIRDGTSRQRRCSESRAPCRYIRTYICTALGSARRSSEKYKRTYICTALGFSKQATLKVYTYIHMYSAGFSKQATLKVYTYIHMYRAGVQHAGHPEGIYI